MSSMLNTVMNFFNSNSTAEVSTNNKNCHKSKEKDDQCDETKDKVIVRFANLDGIPPFTRFKYLPPSIKNLVLQDFDDLNIFNLLYRLETTEQLQTSVMDRLRLLLITYPDGNQVRLGNSLAFGGTNTTALQPQTVSISPDTADGFYTLALLDPDANTRSTHQLRSVVHWLVVNIPISNTLNRRAASKSSSSSSSSSSDSNHSHKKNLCHQKTTRERSLEASKHNEEFAEEFNLQGVPLNVSQGQAIAAYFGPQTATNAGLHRYTFVLFRQSAQITPTSDIPGFLQVGNNRRHFYFDIFASAFLRVDFTPVAFNYFSTRNQNPNLPPFIPVGTPAAII